MSFRSSFRKLYWEARNGLIAANAVTIFDRKIASQSCPMMALIRFQTDCEDALLILPWRKRIRSEPSSALNQVNDQHNDGNHEQKMNQSAAKVADKAQKPEHD